MLKFLSADYFLLEPAGSRLPLLCLFDFGIEGLSKLFTFELPLPLFLELLVEFVLLLSLGVQFVVLVLEDLIESQQFLVEQRQFVFVVVDEILVVAQLHDGYLVFLALLLVVVDLPTPVLQQLPALPDLVLER